MKTLKRNIIPVTLYLIIIIAVLLTLSTAANAQNDTPQDYQWSIYWGETAHLLCYESAVNQEKGESPSGILNFDVTDGGVVTIKCRPPGTVKDGQ